MRGDDYTGMLYDYAADKWAAKQTFTYEDVERDLGWDRRLFYEAVRRVRLTLGHSQDSVTLTCDPQGLRKPWAYQLVMSYEDARAWQANRIGDAEARFETIEAHCIAISRSADGRTVEGRKARKIASVIGYLRGELADIDGRA